MAESRISERHLQLGQVENDLPLQSGEFIVPTYIALHESSLRWTSGPWSKHALPQKDLLADFVRLRDKNAVYRYAKQWGPLGLCKHNLPYRHANCEPVKVGKKSLPVGGRNSGKLIVHDVYEESIDGWLALSGEARAIEEIASYVNQAANGTMFSVNPPKGRSVRKEVGERVQYLNTGFGEALDILDVWAPCMAREAIAERVTKWLLIGGVGPVVRVDPQDRWRIEISPNHWPNLFGMLAISLMASVTNTAFAMCSECGRSYRPKRRPNPNRQNYCNDCGLTAAWRSSARVGRSRRAKDVRPVELYDNK